MGKLLNLSGKKFALLTVIDLHPKRAKNRDARWNCKCECGGTKTVSVSDLKSGKVKSCGCIYHKGTPTHGLTGSPTYKAWREMKTRCLNSNRDSWKYYKNISIYQPWIDSFEAFLSDMGEKPSSDYSLDRIDTNGNYEPSNCRWATNVIQGRNQNISTLNTTGIRGVNFDSINKKWISRITVNKIRKTLYSGHDLFEACCLRKSAENKYWKESNESL